MPLKPTDYSKGVQYKIVCNDPTILDSYNGSTCSLKDRKSVHKKRCNNPNSKDHNLKVYRFIRDNGGWDNWTFIQLEESPCKSKQELLTRERYWFDLLKPSLNSYSPMTTAEEQKEYLAKYKTNHMEERKKYADKYNANHIEERKEYYATNQDLILEKKKEKTTCECGSVINKCHLNRHQKTNKHLSFMNKI